MSLCSALATATIAWGVQQPVSAQQYFIPNSIPADSLITVTASTSSRVFSVGASRGNPVSSQYACPYEAPFFPAPVTVESYSSYTNSTKVAILRAASLGPARPGLADGYYFSIGAYNATVAFSSPTQLSLSSSTRISFATDRPVLLSLPSQTQFPVNVTVTAVNGVTTDSQQYSIYDCAALGSAQGMSSSVASFFSLRCADSTILLTQNPSNVQAYLVSVVDVTVQENTAPRIQFSYLPSSPSNLFAVNLTASLSGQPRISIEVPTADQATVELTAPQAAENINYGYRDKCCSSDVTSFISNSVTRQLVFVGNSMAVEFASPTVAGNTTLYFQVRYGTDFCTPNATIAQCADLVTFPIALTGYEMAPTLTLRQLDALYPGVSSTCRETVRRLACLTVASPCTPGQQPALCKQRCVSDLMSACPALPYGFYFEGCVYAGGDCPAPPVAPPTPTASNPASGSSAPGGITSPSTKTPVPGNSNTSDASVLITHMTLAAALFFSVLAIIYAI